MKNEKTRRQPGPAGENISKSLYHKGTVLDWLILVVVVLIAGVVIALSFGNTTTLATELSLNPYLVAGLVEILFASLLFIRGKQRALRRNVPLFLEIGYFVSLGFITAVNMYGLSKENPVIGPVVGLAISGAMWLMESVLVWLWTKSHEPHRKSMKERLREAEKQIREMKLIQKIEWMKWEAEKPDLALIRMARKADQKRRKVVGDELPAFFRQDQNEVFEQVPEVFEHKTEMFEQIPRLPEVFEQEPNVFEQESKTFEQESKVFEQETETFEQDRTDRTRMKEKPWMKPLLERIKEMVEEEGETPTIRQLMETVGTTQYKAGEALKVWNRLLVPSQSESKGA